MNKYRLRAQAGKYKLRAGAYVYKSGPGPPKTNRDQGPWPGLGTRKHRNAIFQSIVSYYFNGAPKDKLF